MLYASLTVLLGLSSSADAFSLVPIARSAPPAIAARLTSASVRGGGDG